MQDTTTVKDILLPPRLEVLIYFILSALTFGFINVTPIINRILSEPLTSNISADDYLGSLGFLSEVPLVNTAVIVVFWSGVGLVAYTVAWAIINAVIEARNEIVVESEYVNKGSAWSRFKEPLFKSALIVSLFAWISINSKWFLPWLLKDFRNTLVTGQGTDLLKLLLPFAALAANLAIVLVLVRLIRNTQEIIESADRQTA